MSRYALAALITLVAVAGCSSDGASTPTSPSASVPFSTTDLTVGTGEEAATGKAVTVHYALWLYSATAAENKGAFVQSSVGSAPFPFTVGTGVIPGFSQGVVGMKVGGIRRIVVPPSLGYGSQAQQGIPANSTLVFEIALISIP
jgi:FKBP-type peptidyl-prolyl cis-trans isomerase FkpA